MKKAPSGLGLWVAFRRDDPADIAARALAIGAKWVCLRGGAGALNDVSWKPYDDATIAKIISAFHEYGLDVYIWLYSYPSKIVEETAAFARFVSLGADGVYIDAEIEWAGRGDAAVKYGSLLRNALPDTFIADAPWPYIQAHGEYPIKAFDAFVDAHCPQDYWTEIGTSETHALSEQEKEWSNVGAVKPVYPVGVTYGADELIKRGAPPCPGKVSPPDVVAFVDHCLARNGVCSLYSDECMPDDVYQALIARKISLETVRP